MFRSLLVAGLISLTGAASAESFYGIEIGAPLRLPECQSTSMLGAVRYQSFTNFTCVYLKAIGKPQSDENPPTAILFPFAEQPKHSRGNLIGVIVMGDALQVMVVSTIGEPMQQQIMDDLQTKLGSPSNSRTLPFQNQLGATFKGIVANWDRGEPLQVEFIGLANRLDEGQIIFGTKAGLAERGRRMEEAARKFGGRPL